MSTTLPRVNVTFKREVYEALAMISKARSASLSHVISDLVQSALELAEDLALVRFAEGRRESFRRDDALTAKGLLKWNKARKRVK